MNQEINQLIYASRATFEINNDSVMSILSTAVEKNKEHDITGMLVYNGKYFLQLIEGDPEQIKQLFCNISNDKRHNKIVLIGEETSNERRFTHWAMGYVNNSKEIEDIFETATGVKKFNPYSLNFKEAKMLLRKLSYLI